MARYHRSARVTVNSVTKAYEKGLMDINNEIDKIFNTFATNGELTIDEATKLLNDQIPRAEWNAIKAKIGNISDPAIKQRMLNRLNAPAYAARITRLQALKENTYIQSKIIADAEIKLSTSGYIGTMNDAYYRTMFDLQRGLGVGFGFASMPNKTVQTILKRPWSGKHFSKRIWGNTDVLAKQLNEVITAGFMSGSGTSKMTRELRDRMEVSKHVANRLIRTETTYMANAAELESYEEAEIEQYKFLATLDNRTSPICQKHDGKIYEVKDAVPGKNLPALHPYCRSTTIAYFGKDTRVNIQRRARDPKTGKNILVPANMNFAEWQEKYAA
jgi:SPP1 gp7 family putative phage head morphogenesis protein